MALTKWPVMRLYRFFLQAGFHFLTHAEWGCLDGEHKAWIIVEVDTKEDALFILPPLYRATAKIIQLTTFTGKDLLEPERYHQG